MALYNARRIDEKLRQDQNFQKKAVASKGIEELLLFLRKENLIFKQKELVEGMAKCLEHLKLQSDAIPSENKYNKKQKELTGCTIVKLVK